ncbi:MAG: type II toxin-antitoxin system HicA family toxin [Candidatus Solibacter usitatus]|nr:type II toxin-antitoxin system HicA family toxin [Candidatus Solibacter usitatus]
MSRLRPVSRRELVRRLRKLGFHGPFQEGKHPFLVRGVLRLPVPNPHEGDIGIDLLGRILRLAGVTHAEWESTR